MRTTLTLDEDVVQAVRQSAESLNRPFRVVVNQALRLGLRHLEQPSKSIPYTTKARSLGLRKGINLDNIGELLAQMEGEESR